MLLRLTLTVILMYVFLDKAWSGVIQCQRLNEPCVPVPLSCCRGMSCKMDGLRGGFRCQQGRGVLGRCYTRGQLCTPDLSNNPCCDGLVCKTRLLNPKIYECER